MASGYRGSVADSVERLFGQGTVSALSEAQLHDAFRAGGYPRATADRFIARLRQKIADGARLKD